MSKLALSYSFEYLCYGSMDIINILILSVRGHPLGARIWRLQTARAERVKQSKATFVFQLFLDTMPLILIK